MNAGDTVMDVIDKAGVIQMPYPFAAVYTNLETEKVNQAAIEKLYQDSIASISGISKKLVRS